MLAVSQLSIIIPTFYPGPIINNCLDSLPNNVDIIIVDNGNDIELQNIIKKKQNNIRYYSIGDVGLPKSFNFGVRKSKNENILITQPDVTFEPNAINELIKAYNKYENIGLLAPIVYEDKQYSRYNSLDLKLLKNGKIKSLKKKKNFINILPSGDFCVEAVNATVMFFKKNIINQVGGWDENIYTYLEDLDICVKLRKSSLSIIKIKNAIVHHIGFGSHKIENRDKSELLRNWHFCWSSLYFREKYYSAIDFKIYFFEVLIKYFTKVIVNIVLFRFKKMKKNLILLMACLNYLTTRKSNFRVQK